MVAWAPIQAAIRSSRCLPRARGRIRVRRSASCPGSRYQREHIARRELLVIVWVGARNQVVPMAMLGAGTWHGVFGLHLSAQALNTTGGDTQPVLPPKKSTWARDQRVDKIISQLPIYGPLLELDQTKSIRTQHHPLGLCLRRQALLGSLLLGRSKPSSKSYGLGRTRSLRARAGALTA